MNTSHASWPRPSLLTSILALCALVSFFAISGDASYRIVPTGPEIMGYGGGMRMQATGPMAPIADYAREEGYITVTSNAVSAPASFRGKMMDSIAYYPGGYPYQGGGASASDTREFLKVNYGASMETRDVQGLTRRVVATVRGFNGRIDQESSSQKSGYVSFVVPMSKYDAFRTELESLVDSRFLKVDVSSQNLLPQKQSIEEQEKQADEALAQYKAARQKLVSAHASTVKSLQAQIDAYEQQLASLRAQTQTPEAQAQILALVNAQAQFEQRLANENSNYGSQLSNADSNIQYAEQWQKAVKTQDQALLDDVATVNGTVSIQWISWWELAQRYLPGYWIPGIFALLALLSYLNDRRRAVAATV